MTATSQHRRTTDRLYALAKLECSGEGSLAIGRLSLHKMALRKLYRARAYGNDSQAAALGRRVGEDNDWAPSSSLEGTLEPLHLLLINVHLMRAAPANIPQRPNAS